MLVYVSDKLLLFYLLYTQNFIYSIHLLGFKVIYLDTVHKVETGF